MARTLTTTTADPIRIAADHYQIPSISKARAGAVYNLHFNYTTKRWECDCYDTISNGNPNCKHVRRLRAWIHGQMNSSQAQREASEIVQRAPLAAEPLPSLIEEKIAGMELALGQQAEMIRDLQEIVSILQVQQCKTNEHRFQLEDKVKALEVSTNVLVYEVLRLQVAKTAKKQEDVTQENTEAVSDRKAWEEFEKDPEAGRAKQAEKIRAAALNRGNDGFSLLRK